LAEDVVLCASELAANAVLYSNSRTAGGTFTVRTELAPGKHVRIEVADNGGPWAAKPSDPDRAHGLDIIRVLASAWGIEGGRDGRTIWARFDL
jgi:anti-sigma regulatory factor (Ser/Thr protein kinase)